MADGQDATIQAEIQTAIQTGAVSTKTARAVKIKADAGGAETGRVKAGKARTVKTLEQVIEAADFVGFGPEDFDVFGVAEFAPRMAALRHHIKPKLMQIAEILPERLSDAMGEPLYAHVAQHLRRSVNPPVHTWTAFAREPRAYKPFVHLRVAINHDHVGLLVFVEDYAEEKAAFADNLERNAEALGAYLAHHPAIHSFDILDANGKPLAGHALNAHALTRFAHRMRRVKGQHARLGLMLDRAHPVLQSGPEFLDAVVADLRKLKPLYDCGKPGYTFTYTPEISIV